MASTEKVIAAKNAVSRMKQAGILQIPSDTTTGEIMPLSPDGVTVAGDETPVEDAAAELALAHSNNDPFYMMEKDGKFFCMQRMGSHDIEHVSFFKEIKCRGHIFNSHGIIV